MNTFGCSVLKFQTNIVIIKACYHALWRVCKFVLRCKKFYRIGPRNGKPSPNLPRIQAVNVEAALAAASFFSSLPEEIKASLITLKVRSTGAYVLEVNVAGRNIEIRWGLPTDNALKAKVYKALLAQPENIHVIWWISSKPRPCSLHHFWFQHMLQWVVFTD